MCYYTTITIGEDWVWNQIFVFQSFEEDFRKNVHFWVQLYLTFGLLSWTNLTKNWVMTRSMTSLRMWRLCSLLILSYEIGLREILHLWPVYPVFFFVDFVFPNDHCCSNFSIFLEWLVAFRFYLNVCFQAAFVDRADCRAFFWVSRLGRLWQLLLSG